MKPSGAARIAVADLPRDNRSGTYFFMTKLTLTMCRNQCLCALESELIKDTRVHPKTLNSIKQRRRR